MTFSPRTTCLAERPFSPRQHSRAPRGDRLGAHEGIGSFVAAAQQQAFSSYDRRNTTLSPAMWMNRIGYWSDSGRADAALMAAMRPCPGSGRPAIAELGQLVDDLIEGRKDEVGELDLRHRAQAVERHADRGADDAGLGQRRVDDALGSELVVQAGGGTEHPAELADVLAEHHHLGLARHLHTKRVVDGLDDVHGGHENESPRRPRPHAPSVASRSRGLSLLVRTLGRAGKQGSRAARGDPGQLLVDVVDSESTGGIAVSSARASAARDGLVVLRDDLLL